MVETKGERVFMFDGVEYSIDTPSSDDVVQADWCYSLYYSRCLTEGIITASEMAEILKRRGVIGDSYTKQVEAAKETIGKATVDMELATDREQKRELAMLIAKTRNELFSLTQRVNGPMSQTSEQICEDRRVEYLTSRIVKGPDGKKVWPEFDDYLKDTNRLLCFQARLEVMLFMQGLPTDFISNTPENMVLRELEEEDEKLTEQVSIISEPELSNITPIKKQRGRKKAE
jgi:hypothetical protein